MANPELVSQVLNKAVPNFERNQGSFVYSNQVTPVLADKLNLKKRGKWPLSKKVNLPVIPYRRLLSEMAKHYGVTEQWLKTEMEFGQDGYYTLEFEVWVRAKNEMLGKARHDSGLRGEVRGDRTVVPLWKNLSEISTLDVKDLTRYLQGFLLMSQRRDLGKLEQDAYQFIRDNGAGFYKPNKSLIKFFLSFAQYIKGARRILKDPKHWIAIFEEEWKKEGWWVEPPTKGMGPRLLAHRVAKRYLAEQK